MLSLSIGGGGDLGGPSSLSFLDVIVTIGRWMEASRAWNGRAGRLGGGDMESPMVKSEEEIWCTTGAGTGDRRNTGSGDDVGARLGRRGDWYRFADPTVEFGSKLVARCGDFARWGGGGQQGGDHRRLSEFQIGGDSDPDPDPEPGPRWWRQRSSPDSGGGEASRELAFWLQDDVWDGSSGRIPAEGGNTDRSESGAASDLNLVLGRRSTGLNPARIAVAGLVGTVKIAVAGLVGTVMSKDAGGVMDGGGMGRRAEFRASGEMGLRGLGPYECLMEGLVVGLGMVLVGDKRPNKEKEGIRLQVQGTGAPALGE